MQSQIDILLANTVTPWADEVHILEDGESLTTTLQRKFPNGYTCTTIQSIVEAPEADQVEMKFRAYPEAPQTVMVHFHEKSVYLELVFTGELFLVCDKANFS